MTILQLFSSYFNNIKFEWIEALGINIFGHQLLIILWTLFVSHWKHGFYHIETHGGVHKQIENHNWSSWGFYEVWLCHIFFEVLDCHIFPISPLGICTALISWQVLSSCVVLEVLISCKLCSKLIVEARRTTPTNKLVTNLLLYTNSPTITLGTSLVHYIKTIIKLGRNLLLCTKTPTIQTRCFLLHWEENLLELHPVPMGGGCSQKQGQTLPCPRRLLLGMPSLQNFTPHYQHI
jgi:hypothetical protein